VSELQQNPDGNALIFVDAAALDRIRASVPPTVTFVHLDATQTDAALATACRADLVVNCARQAPNDELFDVVPRNVARQLHDHAFEKGPSPPPDRRVRCGRVRVLGRDGVVKAGVVDTESYFDAREY